MRIAALQINTTIGDFKGNIRLLTDGYRKAVEQGAEIVVGPELAICGYPPRDLLFYNDFLEATSKAEAFLAKEIGKIPLIVGNVSKRNSGPGKSLWNSAVVIEEGKVSERVHKSLLPTYDVFDEDRYFQPSFESRPIKLRGVRVGITVCEDIWNDPDFWPDRLYKYDPVQNLIEQGVDLLVNVSASPWHIGKERIREDMLCQLAKKVEVPIVQANAIGGNDELVFDGHSIAIDKNGKTQKIAQGFREEVLLASFDSVDSVNRENTPNRSDEIQLFDALTLGTKDYVRKCGFRDVVLGLSGGIDSALTAAIAVEALGAEHVTGLLMPTEFSSQGSIEDAQKLSETLGIETHLIPIQPAFESLLEQMTPLFKEYQRDVTEENVQARLRGLTLMAVSNKTGKMLLTTGNKSELAAGYCTLYGDMCGGLAVISDLPKTWVYRLSKFLNRNREVIPWNTIEKPPSAELRPDQKDEDSLPPYDVLDDILDRYVVGNQTVDQIAEGGHDPQLVTELIRKVDINEYKRRQAAPGIKVTSKAFGSGRRLPIAQGFRHSSNRSDNVS